MSVFIQLLDGNFAKRNPAFWMPQGFKDIRPLIFTIWRAEKCTRVLLYVVL